MKNGWILGFRGILLLLFFLSFANMMGSYGSMMGGGMFSYGVFYFILVIGLMILMFSTVSKGGAEKAMIVIRGMPWKHGNPAIPRVKSPRRNSKRRK